MKYLTDDTLIDDMGLSIKVANTIKNFGFTTYGEAKSLTDARLLSISGFGPKSLMQWKVATGRGPKPVLMPADWADEWIEADNTPVLCATLLHDEAVCEGRMLVAPEFNDLAPLTQLDIIKDWQDYLEKLWDAAHRKCYPTLHKDENTIANTDAE